LTCSWHQNLKDFKKQHV